MAEKVRLDKVSEDDGDIVTRGYDACKFPKKLFSKTIDSDWRLIVKFELSVTLLFFKMRFESLDVFIWVEFKPDIRFPINFRDFISLISVLKSLPYLRIVLLIIDALYISIWTS